MPVSPPTTIAGPRALDVSVAVAARAGRRRQLGSGAHVLRPGRHLSSGERDAIRALRRAVQLLGSRARGAGIEATLRGVTLLIRDTDAGRRGPWAAAGTVAIGTRNGLLARAPRTADPQVLLPLDTALHELAHVVQFARIPAGVRPHSAILEGVADTVAMLATGDDMLGERYFRRDASGRHRGAIRSLGTRTPDGTPLVGTVARHMDEARVAGTGEHAAGGVVSTAFARLRDHVGRARAERLLWAVIADPVAWRLGGSWESLAAAMRRAATTLWPGDAAAARAVEASLAATGLAPARPAAAGAGATTT